MYFVYYEMLNIVVVDGVVLDVIIYFDILFGVVGENNLVYDVGVINLMDVLEIGFYVLDYLLVIF